MKNLAPVLQTLDQLDTHISNHSIKAEKVSHWSIGMQVEHSLIATQQICKKIISSEPYNGKIKKNLSRRIVLFLGFIPRGRGKAPKVSIPTKEINPADLKALFAKTKDAVNLAANSGKDNWWDHFVFGVMKRDDAFKFIAIHNKHHLKIINDILAKN